MWNGPQKHRRALLACASTALGLVSLERAITLGLDAEVHACVLCSSGTSSPEFVFRLRFICTERNTQTLFNVDFVQRGTCAGNCDDTDES